MGLLILHSLQSAELSVRGEYIPFAFLDCCAARHLFFFHVDNVYVT